MWPHVDKGWLQWAYRQGGMGAADKEYREPMTGARHANNGGCWAPIPAFARDQANCITLRPVKLVEDDITYTAMVNTSAPLHTSVSPSVYGPHIRAPPPQWHLWYGVKSGMVSSVVPFFFYGMALAVARWFACGMALAVARWFACGMEALCSTS